MYVCVLHLCVCVCVCVYTRARTHETKAVCGWRHHVASGVGVQHLERGDVVVSEAADAGEEAESRDTILLLELEHAHSLVQAPVVRPSLVASCNTVDCSVNGVIVLVESRLGAAAVVPGRHVQELHRGCVCLCVKWSLCTGNMRTVHSNDTSAWTPGRVHPRAHSQAHAHAHAIERAHRRGAANLGVEVLAEGRGPRRQQLSRLRVNDRL
jgi:hypothetical protein